MNLSEHFTIEEFEVDGDRIPSAAIPAFVSLCQNILEPIRSHCNAPITITSGYRSPESNAAAHGVPDSQHVATSAYCAADWRVEGLHDLRGVYDWVRIKSGLVLDQMILEHDIPKPDIIHTSWVVNCARLEALEGETANRSGYLKAPFNTAAEAQDAVWS